MSKKILIYLIFLLLSSTGMIKAQGLIAGKIDADGNLIMSENKEGCKLIIQQAGSERMNMPINVTELTFTRLNTGQICLTGYEKTADSEISKGIRMLCYQDDDNNLIVTGRSYTEKIIGEAFAEIISYE